MASQKSSWICYLLKQKLPKCLASNVSKQRDTHARCLCKRSRTLLPTVLTTTLLSLSERLHTEKKPQGRIIQIFQIKRAQSVLRSSYDGTFTRMRCAHIFIPPPTPITSPQQMGYSFHVESWSCKVQQFNSHKASASVDPHLWVIPSDNYNADNTTNPSQALNPNAHFQ